MNSSTKLHKALEQKFRNQFELDVGEGNFVLLTVISDIFQGQSRAERLRDIEPLIEQAGLQPGIVELYTQEEADNEGVTVSNERTPLSWQDAIEMFSSGQKIMVRRPAHSIKRVVFYSYKGGVGRTTALIQTAFQLARAGKRVAVVDMDVEAPALHTLLPPKDMPVQEGLIDYLWERQTSFLSEQHPANIHLSGSNQGKRTGIVYPCQAERNMFVVPAGQIGRRYIQRLSVLSTAHLFNADDPWYQFEQELWEQFQPDIMLIDARTGLNEWGGLSLLQLADEAFITLYPNEQNIEGVRFIRKLLKDFNGVVARLILSPVPEGIIGKKMVESIQPRLKNRKTNEEQFIQIPYHPSIAGCDEFPVEIALPYYAAIANKLLEITGVEKTEHIITQSNRLNAVRSLSFPERDAASITTVDFDAIFQKTDDFERCLDDAVWVIRGRKGTGKSTLYRLFTQHRENAEKRSHGRLEHIDILSAHGNSDEFRPTADIFSKIQKKLKTKEADWLSLWRAYAIIRIYRSCPEFTEILKKEKLKSLLSRLQYNFSNENKIWLSKHTNKLSELATDSNLNAYCRDALGCFNRWLTEKNQKIWLLYDDLDQDIKEDSSWQQEALGGLMRLVYDTNNQDLYQIRFKIFLREDIWNSLVFTNKSHFGEARTQILQWKKVDFLRLAYRLAISGSDEFKNISNRILPLAENDLDEADEETLRQALAPLWGLTQKKKNAYIAQWVYTRLTDAGGNTYPRSLTILLQKAREVELESKQLNAPTDRLLRWSALTKGLTAASEERCNALKNEYSELTDFFNRIGELSSLFVSSELELLWEKTVQEKPDQSFDRFVKRLETIGLIEKKKNNSKFDYAVANLYIDGFGIKRKQGQRK
jgi:MinD-like ATPase involved in chromosome partitioning or flagellar assembly